MGVIELLNTDEAAVRVEDSAGGRLVCVERRDNGASASDSWTTSYPVDLIEHVRAGDESDAAGRNAQMILERGVRVEDAPRIGVLAGARAAIAEYFSVQ